MADLTDIKAILYTEKSLIAQAENVITVKTSNRVTKNSLKEIFRDYLGIKVLRVNSLCGEGKLRRFRGTMGRTDAYKKFYVKVPADAKLDQLLSV